ncbi:MAG: TfoX/Sxy family protein, partial [Myxococcota bacterium]
MAYNEALAERVRGALARRRHISEKKMFGGIAFLVRGNMACGVVGRKLMVRVGPDAYEKALAHKDARKMDFTGRPMKGFLYVMPAGVKTTRA